MAGRKVSLQDIPNLKIFILYELSRITLPYASHIRYLFATFAFEKKIIKHPRYLQITLLVKTNRVYTKFYLLTVTTNCTTEVD